MPALELDHCASTSSLSIEIETVAELGNGQAEGRIYRLAWSLMPRVGPTLMLRLEEHFGSLAIAWCATEQALGQVPGFGLKTLAEVMAAKAKLDPAETYSQHLRVNPDFWMPEDADYPLLLRELPTPPQLLYYRGTVEPAENWGEKMAVAIVGTRHPSDYGLKWTRKLSRTLAQAGFTVVSGLADGIDTAAHRACLDAGGRTIAVVGTGVDRVYPARNRHLCQRVVEQGIVLSEYPAGTHAHRGHFPQRNRIIAGLCRATIVVEAPKRSGALITAYAANEYCRDVYVVPGDLDNPKVRGGLELIGQGAQLILDEQHLLELLAAMPALNFTTASTTVRSHPTPMQTMAADQVAYTSDGSAVQAQTQKAASAPEPELTSELAGVYMQLSPEAQSLDELVASCGMETGALSGALLQLEMLNLITELPGKRYRRC